MEQGKIYTFKLNSGEEVIAKYIEQEDNYITVQAPVSIMAGPKGVQLMPTLFTVDPDGQVTLNINSVSIYADTDESVQGKYIEATTGIQVPDKKILVG